MHGVKRGTRSNKQEEKIGEYVALTEDVLRRKKKGDKSTEALALTARLLQINPEFYTVWNYRRHILLDGIFPQKTAEEVKDMIESELGMTTALLSKTHGKVYWVWNHRRWCLESMPAGPGVEGTDTEDGWRRRSWEQELGVAEKVLGGDARNFHAWNYRRYVLGRIGQRVELKGQLGYTRAKIEANMSNFSAWHERSRVIGAMLEGGQLSEGGRWVAQELELVHNAMYTDPEDSSVWMYHRWLVRFAEQRTLEREVEVIEELMAEQPDSRWSIESILRLKGRDPSLVSQLIAVDPMRAGRYLDEYK